MNILPWQSYELHTGLPTGEVLRLLDLATPPCRRFPDLSGEARYFCGWVDPEEGQFELRRNTAGKARGLFPIVRGRVLPAGRGSTIEIVVQPSVVFWLVLIVPAGFLTFLPAGPLAWLSGSLKSIGELLLFLLIPILAVVFLSWMWAPPLLVTYVSRGRYRRELVALLLTMEDRTAEGLSVLEAPETPEQQTRREQKQKLGAENAFRIVAVALALFGFMLGTVGLGGLLTGELTLHGRGHHQRTAGASVTLRGDQARRVGLGLLSLGSGLAVCGAVAWRMAPHAPRNLTLESLRTAPWRVLETGLACLGVALLVAGAGLCVWGNFS